MKMVQVKTNKITTIGGIIMGLPALLQTAGVIIDPAIVSVISAIGGLVVGLGAKDGNVTGGDTSNAT